MQDFIESFTQQPNVLNHGHKIKDKNMEAMN